MKQLLLPLYSLLLLTTVTAQSGFPPIYNIQTDTAFSVTLPDTYWQEFEDKDGKLTIGQIMQSSISQRFNFDTLAIKKLSSSGGAFWFRYTLKNVMNHETKVWFPSFGEQSDFYFIKKDGKKIHRANGYLTPWRKLDGLKLPGYILMVIKPKEEIVVYNRAFNHFFFFGPIKPISIGYMSTEKILQQNYVDNEVHYFNAIHDSFLFGVLAFASLFVFFFYIIVHERLYLYFSLYLFSLGLGRFNVDLELYQVFLREYPVLYGYFFNIVWMFSIFFLTYFIRDLLNTQRYLRQWDKFLLLFNLIYALSYVLFFVSFFHFQNL